MLDRQIEVILSINSFKMRTKDWLLERVVKYNKETVTSIICMLL